MCEEGDGCVGDGVREVTDKYEGWAEVGVEQHYDWTEATDGYARNKRRSIRCG